MFNRYYSPARKRIGDFLSTLNLDQPLKKTPILRNLAIRISMPSQGFASELATTGCLQIPRKVATSEKYRNFPMEAVPITSIGSSVQVPAGARLAPRASALGVP
jgi:hypothetical protein